MIVLQAIVTKYFGPGNVRGSRIKATAAAGSITVHYNSSLGTDDNHAAAAKAFALKMGWDGYWFAGGMPEGCGNVFVCTNEPALKGAAFVIADGVEI